MSVVLDAWSGTSLFLLWCILFAILITDVWLPCKTSQTSRTDMCLLFEQRWTHRYKMSKKAHPMSKHKHGKDLITVAE